MTKIRISKLLLIALVMSIGALGTSSGQAQDYPTRPIQVIVPFAGGSASDVVTRILLHDMSKSLGQNFVVDNRPGAGGNTGTAAAIKAAADGYTLLMSTSGPLAANKNSFQNPWLRPGEGPCAYFAIRGDPECDRHQLQPTP